MFFDVYIYCYLDYMCFLTVMVVFPSWYFVYIWSFWCFIVVRLYSYLQNLDGDGAIRGDNPDSRTDCPDHTCCQDW